MVTQTIQLQDCETEHSHIVSVSYLKRQTPPERIESIERLFAALSERLQSNDIDEIEVRVANQLAAARPFAKDIAALPPEVASEAVQKFFQRIAEMLISLGLDDALVAVASLQAGCLNCMDSGGVAGTLKILARMHNQIEQVARANR
jgi:hypothetical protein